MVRSGFFLVPGFVSLPLLPLTYTISAAKLEVRIVTTITTKRNHSSFLQFFIMFFPPAQTELESTFYLIQSFLRVWVSGKYLQAYVYLKNRMALGRIPYSPELVRGRLAFESSGPSDSIGLRLVNSTFPTLTGIMRTKMNLTDYGLEYSIAGAPHQNITIKFHTPFKPSISCNTSRWSYTHDPSMETTLIWFIPEGDVEITLRKFSQP